MNTRFTKSYGYTSPYGGCWLEHYYARGGCNFFGEKIKTEKHFKEMLSRAVRAPTLLFLGISLLTVTRSRRCAAKRISIRSAAKTGFFHTIRLSTQTLWAFVGSHPYRG